MTREPSSDEAGPAVRAATAQEVPLGVGLIGAGGFGRFCLGEYQKTAGCRPVAVADMDPEAARVAADTFKISFSPTPEALLANPDVDVVHIATPPASHKALALAAMGAGKHVLCEKPLATTLGDGRAVLNAARDTGRVIGVNFIMRYDPLCTCVEEILRQKILGEPLHAICENYASDENLSPGHWFWDLDVSGGIFIEHGVHFFDLFEMWFGQGKVVAAQRVARPGGDPERPLFDQVNCSVTYGGAVTANFYHGFHQAGIMDRQEIRIVCERGSIRLFEWVPCSLEIDALLTDELVGVLEGTVPGFRCRPVEKLAGGPGKTTVTGRGKKYTIDGRYRVEGGLGMGKSDVYGLVLRALMEDQVAAIRDPAHRRRVNGENGFRSLAMAVDCESLARRLEHGIPRQQYPS